MNRTLLLYLLAIFYCWSAVAEEEPKEGIGQNATTFAESIIDSLTSGNIDYCIKNLDKEFQNDQAVKYFEECHEALNNQEFVNSSVVSYEAKTIYSDPPSNSYKLSFEYEYKDLWVYYTFILIENEKHLVVYQFNYSSYPDSVRVENEFNFIDKGFVHYLFIGFCSIVPLFILVSLVFCFRTQLKRKWLWILFILMGIAAFNLNWTTGEIGVDFTHMKIFGSGYKKISKIGPWILSFSIPIGAILFWFKRAKIRRQERNTGLSESLDQEDGN